MKMSFQSILLRARKGIRDPVFQTVSLSPPDIVYFMGICGTAMASLAVFLKSNGFHAFGSDSQIYPPMSSVLRDGQISVKGYGVENLNSSIRLAIVGNVISRGHSELEALEKYGIAYISFPEFLNQVILSGRKNIVIAGTHGKTTTTTLTARAARAAGKNPGFFIGALARDFKTPFHLTSSKWFVIEGDEYDTAFFEKTPKFFHYSPFALILTGLEFDHADIYKDLKSLVRVFSHLTTRVPPQGCIVASAESKALKDILENPAIKAPVLTYGIQKGDFQIQKVCFKPNKTQFEILHAGKRFPVTLNLLGEHNILNALSVFALGVAFKWPLKEVLKSFESFQGIKKRLDKTEAPGGILIIEDFAHHPTAVRMTLKALKKAFPKRTIRAVFEPRSWTACRNIFQKDYVKALSVADSIAVMKPFRTFDKSDQLCQRKLVCDIQSEGKTAFSSDTVIELSRSLVSLSCSGDILVLMSNGDFGGLKQKLKQGLKKKFP